MARLENPHDLKDHPGKDIVPDLTPERYESLRESIKVHGVLQPIIVSDPDIIIDGHTRVAIAQEFGLAEVPVERRILTTDEEEDLLVELNFSRRQLTREQKQETAGKLRSKGWTQARVARVIGVDQSTVARWLADVMQTHNEDAPALPDTVTDSLGRNQPATKPRLPTPSKPKSKVDAQRDSREREAPYESPEEATARMFGGGKDEDVVGSIQGDAPDTRSEDEWLKDEKDEALDEVERTAWGRVTKYLANLNLPPKFTDEEIREAVRRPEFTEGFTRQARYVHTALGRILDEVDAKEESHASA